VALLNWLRGKSPQLLLAVSTYPNEIYTWQLGGAGWGCVEFDAMTRGGTVRREHLWCSYPEVTALHDYRYYGGNKRSREVIRKRGRSLARKLSVTASRDPLAAKAVLSYGDAFR
jgi:hypothetical protein